MRVTSGTVVKDPCRRTQLRCVCFQTRGAEGDPDPAVSTPTAMGQRRGEHGEGRRGVGAGPVAFANVQGRLGAGTACRRGRTPVSCELVIAGCKP